MANTPKRSRPGSRSGGSGKETKSDRRAMVEQMRRQQDSADKRRNLIFVGIAATLGVGLIAAAAIPAYIQTQNSPRAQAISSFGVPAGEAGCGEILSEPASGEMEHVPEGMIDYATVPPSFGSHRPMWTDFERKFYTPEDRPEMEALVHNLEHGYTVVWYDQTIAEDEEQLQALRGLTERIPEEPGMGKFKVSAWDDAYGEFPENMHIGISHWGGDETGYRQLCESVSGEIINAFMVEYPSTNAPEPRGG